MWFYASVNKNNIVQIKRLKNEVCTWREVLASVPNRTNCIAAQGSSKEIDKHLSPNLQLGIPFPNPWQASLPSCHVSNKIIGVSCFQKHKRSRCLAIRITRSNPTSFATTPHWSIEVFGIKQPQILLPISPFSVSICVHVDIKEHYHLSLLSASIWAP